MDIHIEGLGLVAICKCVRLGAYQVGRRGEEAAEMGQYEGNF